MTISYTFSSPYKFRKALLLLFFFFHSWLSSAFSTNTTLPPLQYFLPSLPLHHLLSTHLAFIHPSIHPPIHSSIYSHSAQLIRIRRRIEDGDPPVAVLLDAVVLEHLVVDAGVVALDGEGGLRDGGVEHEVVVAVRAVLVGLLELLRVLAEALLALLARERHLEGPQQLVRLFLGVALGAVEPFLACLFFCPRSC